MSITFSWFGHMDQQDCSNFFTTSTASDLPSNLQWKLILGHLGHEAGSKIGHESIPETYLCWPLPALQVHHPYHVKWGVIHTLIHQAQVIYQGQKDFNKEIKNKGHDLMLNEYRKTSVDSIIKPSRKKHISSDTIYQGIVIIPYVKGMSEKFRCTGNFFNVSTIFKTKHTLNGTFMKSGPVRETYQM
jgi:hypothetical protein